MPLEQSSLSYWEKTTLLGHHDLIVIGSGIVGISTALELRKHFPKKSIVILERGSLPSGASTKNAGFTCFGSTAEILDDLQHTPEETVFQTVEKRWRGLLNLRAMLGDDALQYKGWSSFELFRSEDKAAYAESCDRLDYLNKNVSSITGESDVYRLNSDIIANSGFSGILSAIENRLEGQVNTGMMMQAFLRKAQEAGIIIYNGIGVDSFHENGSSVALDTTGGNFTCDRLFIATNGFAKQFFPEVDVAPARAQVLITKPIPGLRIKGTFHYDAGYYYFRNIDDRVLLGGGRNLDFETETTTELVTTERITSALSALLKDVILPNTAHEIDYSWAGVMGVGKQKMPIVKQVSDRVCCGVRLGGMGVAIGSLVGKELADLATD